MAALPLSTLEFFKVRAPEIISVVNKKSPFVPLEMISPLPNEASPVIVRSPVIVALPLVVIAPPSAMVMAKSPSV